MTISLFLCFHVGLIPLPGSLNDLGFSVYTQNLLIHCSAAIVSAQVSSWTWSTTSHLSEMMHILLSCFAQHIWIIVNVYFWCAWVHARGRAGLLNLYLTSKPYKLCSEYISPFIHVMYRMWVHSGRKASVHPTLEHVICPTCCKTNKKLRKKKNPLIQVKFLSNQLDAATAQ